MTLSHADRVAAVARQVVSRPAGAKITIRKNTPAHSIRDQGYKRGLHPVDVSALDQINQDMGVRLERLAEGVRWIEEHLGVYPIWNCAVRLPDAARATFKGSSHLVDLGIYGEPKVAGYRRVSAMRALQTMADIPSLWGVSYLSWAQLSNTFPERYARYERARQQVAADAAFLHLRDKVVWIAPDAPDPGPIPMWRLRRSYGARWYLNPVSYLVLGAAAVSKAIWRTPAGLG
jgi:hypothetical protein